VGYISEIMCDNVDKGFNYDVLLLTCDFLKKHVVQFLVVAWLLCDCGCVFCVGSDGAAL
jgi:hypothetical protein